VTCKQETQALFLLYRNPQTIQFKISKSRPVFVLLFASAFIITLCVGSEVTLPTVNRCLYERLSEASNDSGYFYTQMHD